MLQRRKKVGLLGYGESGRYIVDCIFNDPLIGAKLEIAFVWNRTAEAVKNDLRLKSLILEDITQFQSFSPDLIIEVAHPIITKQYSSMFLDAGCDYFIGSPSILADREIEDALKTQAIHLGRTVYIPVGALWGAMDIQKMADRGSLMGLSITMKIHPDSLKLVGDLANVLKVKENLQGEQLLYSGPVRQLCPMAPNNVNTMACAAIAAHTLGFDKTQGILICDNSLNAHIIEIDVEGPDKGTLGKFSLKTVRINPALPGAVTGTATLASFVNSILASLDLLPKPGFQLC